MANDQTRESLDRVLRLAMGAMVPAILLGLLRYLSDVLLPFAAAVVLAYLLNPLVTVFERKIGRRSLAVALTIGGLGIMAVALVAIVIPLTALQVSRFGEDLRQLRRDLVASVDVALEEADELSDAFASAGAGTTPATADDVEPGGLSVDSSDSKPLGWGVLKEAWARFLADAKEGVPRLQRMREFRAALTGTYLGDYLEKAIKYVDSDAFSELLLSAAKRVAVGGWTVVAFTVNFVLGLAGLIIVLLYLVFILLDYPEYARTWPTFLPPKYREPIVDFLAQFESAMRRYFRGQALIALCMGILFSIGFSIIGLPMAVPFGLFVGLLNMVPYLQTVGLVPAMLLALLRSVEGNSSVMASILLALAVFAVAQIIQDALITPRIMGKATGLRPVAILLGVFIWGKLLGFLGLLLAIPLTCLGIAYYRRYVLRHSAEVAGVTGEPT